MIDKSIPHGSVIMIKRNMNDYPRFELPEGFIIRPYQKGDEVAWAEIALEQFLLDSYEEALKLFHENFDSHPEWMDRCLFAVEEKTGTVAAYLALWEGGVFSSASYKKIHWVATRECYQGKGLVKALMTRAMDLYHELGDTLPCILQTSSPNWKAIRIYKKFGFEAWLGEDPAPTFYYDDELEHRNWKIINDKIAEVEAAIAAAKK